MKLFFSTISLLILVGCSAEKQLKEQRETWHYNNWKDRFKDRVFCKCLLVGYGKKEITNPIQQIDKSYYDAIGIAVFDKTIDSLLQIEAAKMTRDSLESLNTVAEAAAGKRVFSHCLQFYKSRELDSITKAESKKWRKITNIDSLVMKAVPAY
jgi:hypothetical protein